MTKKNSDTGKTVSIRLDQETQEKLDRIMKARGVNQSQAVRMCINEIPILQIGNVNDLAPEFYKIRVALENNSYDNEIREEVNGLCLSIYALIQAVEASVNWVD